ncbi:basic proline-rich protein-like [Peromyscus leucopus]|uniref:basic proline-rich protein-like n=1 Tax=Peromyscus leucopus TaxID=10041 RepID=UPI00188560AD|nr:basic proline-rich protein-like [Peromyscus leucopus]
MDQAPSPGLPVTPGPAPNDITSSTAATATPRVPAQAPSVTPAPPPGPPVRHPSPAPRHPRSRLSPQAPPSGPPARHPRTHPRPTTPAGAMSAVQPCQSPPGHAQTTPPMTSPPQQERQPRPSSNDISYAGPAPTFARHPPWPHPGPVRHPRPRPQWRHHLYSSACRTPRVARLPGSAPRVTRHLGPAPGDVSPSPAEAATSAAPAPPPMTSSPLQQRQPRPQAHPSPWLRPQGRPSPQAPSVAPRPRPPRTFGRCFRPGARTRGTGNPRSVGVAGGGAPRPLPVPSSHIEFEWKKQNRTNPASARPGNPGFFGVRGPSAARGRGPGSEKKTRVRKPRPPAPPAPGPTPRRRRPRAAVKNPERGAKKIRIESSVKNPGYFCGFFTGFSHPRPRGPGSEAPEAPAGNPVTAPAPRAAPGSGFGGAKPGFLCEKPGFFALLCGFHPVSDPGCEPRPPFPPPQASPTPRYPHLRLRRPHGEALWVQNPGFCVKNENFCVKKPGFFALFCAFHPRSWPRVRVPTTRTPPNAPGTRPRASGSPRERLDLAPVTERGSEPRPPSPPTPGTVTRAPQAAPGSDLVAIKPRFLCKKRRFLLEKPGFFALLSGFFELLCGFFAIFGPGSETRTSRTPPNPPPPPRYLHPRLGQTQRAASWVQNPDFCVKNQFFCLKNMDFLHFLTPGPSPLHHLGPEPTPGPPVPAPAPPAAPGSGLWVQNPDFSRKKPKFLLEKPGFFALFRGFYPGSRPRVRVPTTRTPPNPFVIRPRAWGGPRERLGGCKTRIFV